MAGIRNTIGDFPKKAMILAAGLSTRLGPLTDDRPKCMMLLGGKPLLEYTVEWLRDFGVTHIIINLCYLPETIRSYFEDGRTWGVQITYSQEEKPLGTAGGVKKVAWFFDGPFFVWYGDNLSHCDLDRLHRLHVVEGGLATVALHHRDDPSSQSGIVGLDANGRIVRFLEKPGRDQVFSNWVNAGIFVLEPEVLDFIPEEGCPDFGKDVFPTMLAAGQPLYGYLLSPEEGLWWIDTPEDLQRVQKRIAEEGGNVRVAFRPRAR